MAFPEKKSGSVTVIQHGGKPPRDLGDFLKSLPKDMGLPPKGGDMTEDEDEGDDKEGSYKEAAQSVIDAMDDHDADALSKALKSFVDLCNGGMSEEEEPSSEKY